MHLRSLWSSWDHWVSKGKLIRATSICKGLWMDEWIMNLSSRLIEMSYSIPQGLKGSNTQRVPNTFVEMLPRMWRIHCWWNCKSVQAQWKAVWRFPRKLESSLPQDPAILLQGICSEEMKRVCGRDTCSCLLTAALLPTAKKWNQPKLMTG